MQEDRLSAMKTESVFDILKFLHEGSFRQYDYGFIKNVFKYGNNKPPEYNLAVVTSPVSMIIGPNDWLATPEGAGLLYKSLPHPIRYYTVEHRDFNHFDFLWATDVKTLVNEKVLQLLKYNADMTIENNKIITDNVAQSWQGLNKDLQYL